MPTRPPLALGMPVGLTRGLAICRVLGIAAGLPRGARPDVATRIATFPLVFVLVTATGLDQLGGKQTTVDGLELATACTIEVTLLRKVLKRWWALALACTINGGRVC